MKNLRLFTNSFVGFSSRTGKLTWLLIVLIISSCQKEPLPGIHEPPAQHVAASRTTPSDAQILASTQWFINNFVPLASDQDVYDDIIEGNQTSPLVTSKLASLGYSDINAFTQAFTANMGEVLSALNSGTLTASSLEQTLLQHMNEINFGVLDNGTSTAGMNGYLPCYEQFLTDLSETLVLTAVASGSGPWTSAITGVVGVAYSYWHFKNCLKENYGNGN